MRTQERRIASLAGLLAVLSAWACSGSTKSATGDSAQVSKQQGSLGDSASMIARNLMKFDTLDFIAFSHQ